MGTIEIKNGTTTTLRTENPNGQQMEQQLEHETTMETTKGTKMKKNNWSTNGKPKVEQQLEHERTIINQQIKWTNERTPTNGRAKGKTPGTVNATKQQNKWNKKLEQQWRSNMGQQLEHGSIIMDQMEHWWKHN